MRLSQTDNFGKYMNKTEQRALVAWFVLWSIALLLALRYLPTDAPPPPATSKAVMTVGGDIPSLDLRNMKHLWFSPNGALVGVREEKTIEVLSWRDPLKINEVERREIDPLQLIVAGFQSIKKHYPDKLIKQSDPTSYLPLTYAVSRDGSTIAIILEEYLVAQSTSSDASQTQRAAGFYPAGLGPNAKTTVSQWIGTYPATNLGFTNDKLVVLYDNGTLESHDPYNLKFKGYQDSELTNPTGLWTSDSFVAAASFASPKLRVFDFSKTTEYSGEDGVKRIRATVIADTTPPGIIWLDAFVIALSKEGKSAYSLRTSQPEVFVVNPSPSQSGAAGEILKLQAKKSVGALAFSGEDLLASEGYDEIHWLGNEAIATTAPFVSLLAASSTSLAFATNDKLFTTSLHKVVIAGDLQPRGRRWREVRWLAIGIWATLIGLPLIGLFYRWKQDKEESGNSGISLINEQLSPPKLPDPPPDLVKACAAGECVLYGGAGLSAQAGFPVWQKFVQDLTAWTIKSGFVENSLAVSLQAALDQGEYNSVADNIVSAMRSREDQLQAYLREVFTKSVSLPASHKILKNIPFSAVLTTNFDTLLEDTYKGRQAVVYTPKDAEKLLETLTKREFFLLKLYGTLDRKETVMVAPAQYEDAIKGNLLFSQFMETLFFSRTLFFIGASLEGIETYLKGISFSRQNLRTHYALVAVTGNAWLSKAIPLKSRYGIEVLPYSPTGDNTELQNFLKKLEAEASAETERTKDEDAPTTRLKRIILTDIGPFEHIEINFNSRWNILLGDNGSGKSTILKALAISILGEDAKSFAERLIKAGKTSGEITLITDRNTYRTKISRRNGEAKVESVPGRAFESEGWLAIGFPPLRTISWARPKEFEAQTKGRPTPDDLLPLITGEPDPRLDKLKQWIVNLDYLIKDARSRGTDPARHERLIDEFFNVVGQLTKGLNVRFKEVKPETHEVTITTNDGDLPIESLSQGMTSLIGWVGILLQRLYEVYGDDEEPRHRYALVLMDEIDAHLHPAWQQSLVRELGQIFPNVQFIATTHSPLIVGGMLPEQILRFARDEEGEVVQYEVEEEMTLGRADQILTGDLFSLQTTFSLNPNLEKDMEEYHQLLANDNRQPREEIRFQKLRESLKTRVPLTGETPPERKAMALIDALLKGHTDEKYESVNQALREKAEKLLIEVGKRKNDSR